MSEEMNLPPPLSPQEREMENALTALRPAAPRVNRDSLMYEAGFAAGRNAGKRQVMGWRIAAGFLICATAAMAIWHPQRVENGASRPTSVAVVPSARPSIPVATASIPVVPSEIPQGDSYLDTRQRVLILGMSALPSLPDSPPTASARSSHVRADVPDASPAWQLRAANSTGDHL